MDSNHLFKVYGDFNCPFCYALHERLHDTQLIGRCEWRGVQHASYLPRPMKAWQGTHRAELEHEVAVVRRLAPGLPIAMPSGKPNTGLAIAQAIAVLSQDISLGRNFIREAYRAFWRDGLDLSDPKVLEQVLRAIGAPMEKSGAGLSERLAREWEKAWHETGQASVPIIVSPDGELLVGCLPREHILRFFGQLS
jgi:2-hydroxychromene-2-carboxylate isomerase